MYLLYSLQTTKIDFTHDFTDEHSHFADQAI